MTKISKAFSRGFIAVAVAGLGLALTPGAAQAEFIDFTVDEGGVPGAIDVEHTVDKINGGYTEKITFGALGAFDVSAYAQFGQYFSNQGSVLVATQLNNFGVGGYGLYALFTASGTFNGTTLVGDSALVKFYLDPLQDTSFGVDGSIALAGAAGTFPTPAGTADDLELMVADNLISGVGIPGDPGAFDFKFLDPVLTLPDGQNYWPFLDQLTVRMTVDGDIDEFILAGTQIVTGDLSVVFVPEPATLSLLGMGLLGVAASLRRRSKAKANVSA